MYTRSDSGPHGRHGPRLVGRHRSRLRAAVGHRGRAVRRAARRGDTREGGEARPGDPYETVKTIYDEWKSDLGEERQLSDQGAAYVITYLLERERLADLRGRGQGTLLKRHPGADELRERFWEREQTLRWMAVELGVHYSLVTFWLWEADIPLAERNLSDETVHQIEAGRDG